MKYYARSVSWMTNYSINPKIRILNNMQFCTVRDYPSPAENLTVNLKRKTHTRIRLHLFFLGRLGGLVRYIAVHMDGPEGFCGTGMLASAPAHADFLVHFRDDQLVACRIQAGYHVYRFGGTMFRAGPAIGVVRINHTVFFDKFCHATWICRF